MKFTQERKEKIRQIAKEKGYGKWMIGRSHSKETKKRMSLAKKGKPFSGTHSDWNGKKHTEETKLKTSGENSYMWKGGISIQTRIKYCPRPKPNKCDVCGKNWKICYDHDHKTDKFRGWLCGHCNSALGMVNDDIDILEGLIKYLKNNPRIEVII